VAALQNNKIIGHRRKLNTVSRSSSPYCIHLTDYTNFSPFWGGVGDGFYVSVSKSDCIAWEYCDESEMVPKKAVVPNGGTENNL
jgi:hypothetical protein